MTHLIRERAKKATDDEDIVIAAECVKALRFAHTTACNDDVSQPMTEKRSRHVARGEAMLRGARCIEAQESELSRLTAECDALAETNRLTDQAMLDQIECIGRLTAENKAMREALEECKAYFEPLQDIRDGAGGQQLPNEEMRLLTEIRQALGELPG